MSIFLIAAGTLYACRWSSLRRRRPRSVLVGHLAAFQSGLVVIWIAVVSPVAHLHHDLLTGHMVQHLLLMVVAAPVILFGAMPISRRQWLPKLLRTIQTRLWFCWLVGSLTVIVWHIPAVFEMALWSNPLHALERASFFAAGLVFWYPVICSRLGSVTSRWPVPLYLFLATLPCDVLSAFLTFSDDVAYRPYLSGSGQFQLTPREDQALAGTIMWLTVTLAYMVPALILTSRLLRVGASEKAANSVEAVS